MTGDEDAFVVWFISAHPASKHPTISTTIAHLIFFTCFLLVCFGSQPQLGFDSFIRNAGAFDCHCRIAAIQES
jgi:hypothetical protein